VSRLVACLSRRDGDPRWLIAAFAFLNVTTIGLTALAAGEPSYDGNGWFGTLFVLGLIAYFLARGSRVAWWLALLWAAPSAFVLGWFAFFGAAGFDPKELAAAVLQAFAVWVLIAPALEASLGSRRRARLA